MNLKSSRNNVFSFGGTFGVVFLILFFAGVLDFFAFTQSLTWQEMPVEVQSDQPMADMIVVLTGGPRRVLVGLELIQAGRGQKLLISGTDPEAGLTDILSANQFSLESPELVDAITLDRASLTTRDNVAQIIHQIRDQKFSSLIVVSAGYHLPRIQKLLRKSLRLNQLHEQVKITYWPVWSFRFQGDWWWRPRSWWLLLSEYFKWRLSF